MHETKTALVVSDHPAMRDLLGAFPTDPEWRVETVPDSVKALKCIQNKAYDLVLTGLATSGEEDVDLLRQMRRVRPHLKLIILTEKNAPDAILASIREHAFSYFSGPFDSQTLFEMIERALKEPVWDDGIEVVSARPEWIALRLKCRMVTAERILHFMQELRAELPQKQREDIGTVFREMLLNAMEHGGKFDPEQTVEVNRICSTQIIVYIIRDSGEGFSFSSLPHSAVSNSAEELFAHVVYREEHGIRPGGFGILFSKGLVDELIYNEKGNEVVLIKHLV